MNTVKIISTLWLVTDKYFSDTLLDSEHIDFIFRFNVINLAELIT